MIYICAGMPRSGSTWLFNVMRVLLKHGGSTDIAGGYVAQTAELLTHRTSIIKLHPFDYELATKADVILTSHRDLRDIAASMQRHYERKYSPADMNEWVKSQVKWAQYAAYDLHYENMITEKLSEVKKIAGVLKFSPQVLAQLDYDAILDEIDNAKFKKKFAENVAYDSENLLHEGHITDGRHGSWDKVVKPEFISSIEWEFRGWMTSRGYMARTAVVS